jgi:hypothetical protein
MKKVGHGEIVRVGVFKTFLLMDEILKKLLKNLLTYGQTMSGNTLRAFLNIYECLSERTLKLISITFRGEMIESSMQGMKS